MNKDQQIVFIYTVNGGEPRRLYMTRADVDDINERGWVPEVGWDGNGQWYRLPVKVSLVAFNVLEGRIAAGFRTLHADLKEGAA
jgi:hypothetical protein